MYEQSHDLQPNRVNENNLKCNNIWKIYITRIAVHSVIILFDVTGNNITFFRKVKTIFSLFTKLNKKLRYKYKYVN